MIFLPRYLGDQTAGEFHVARSAWAITGIFVTFGMDLLLTKEIARDRDKTSAYISTTILLRLPLNIIAYGALFLFARTANYSLVTIQIILIFGIGQFIWQTALPMRNALEGIERMEYISYADIASKVLNTVVTLILIFMKGSVLAIAAVNIGMALAYLIVVAVPLHRLQPIRFTFDPKLAVWMLKAGAPYFVVSGFLVFYTNMDAIIMSFLVEDEVIGWYSVVDQLFGTLLFVPSIFITAIFPVMSRLFNNDSDQLPRMMQQGFNLLLLLSVPIGFGAAVISEPLVLLLYGDEFINSAPIFSVLGIVLLLMYQNILLGRFLVSVDRQNLWTIVMGCAVVLTIAVDFVLIPVFDNLMGNGAVGGAVAYVITEGLMLALGLYLLRENFNLGNVYTALRTLVAGALMAAAVWLVRDMVLIVPILVGVVVYGALVLLFKLIPPEMMLYVRRVLPHPLKAGS